MRELLVLRSGFIGSCFDLWCVYVLELRMVVFGLGVLVLGVLEGRR